jgi:acyl-CoA hydrolase
VVTTRAHVHFVVTEYGVANLYGLSLRQRARALIDVSHPDHREPLERAARERFGALAPSQR